MLTAFASGKTAAEAPPRQPLRLSAVMVQGSKGGFFPLWSNKNSGQKDLSTFRLMISLKSWPEALVYYKTPARTDQF